MMAAERVRKNLCGGISYRSRELRRRALSNLFRAEYGVGWGDALEENFSETTVFSARGHPRSWAAQYVKVLLPSGLDVAAVHVPALLIFARGPLPEQINLSPDLWQAVRTDQREYGIYFQKYLLRIENQNPALQVKVLADARNYFFLKDPAQIAHWVKDFMGRQIK